VRSTLKNCRLRRKVLERKPIPVGVSVRWQGAPFIRIAQQQTVDTTCPLFSRLSWCSPTLHSGILTPIQSRTLPKNPESRLKPY
jgi:hypothetical protein